MNRFFKLLYVNLLGLFDINKIKVAREDGVKSNLEKKTIITAIVALFYGFLLYKFFTSSGIANKINILVIGFALSSLFCLIMDINLIEPIIFKSEDNDMLFSLPLSRYQIIFSKLFNIYLKNLIAIVIIMFSSLLAYTSFKLSISDEVGLMYVISSLFIPFIPIVIASIISYINSYLKVKFINNKIYYYIIKYLVLALVFVSLFLIFIDTKVSSIDGFIKVFLDKFNVMYPMSFFFYIMIRDENVLFFVLLFLIPILVIYLYSFFLSNNYLKICSMLKGIKKKVEFKFKKTLNLHRVFGMVRKEIIGLFKNKYYLLSSFGMLGFFTIALFVGLHMIDLDKISRIKDFAIYLKLYCPTLLAMLVTFNSMNISSMSLEKDNMQILRTMPIGMEKVLFGKWLSGVLLGSIFIIINSLLVYFYLSNDVILLIFNILVSLSALMFVSLTSLTLDYRFICKDENNDNVIIKQRLITLIPTFLALVIGVVPFFLPAYVKYEYALGSYILLFVILMAVEIGYMFINRKKLIRGLFN